MKNLFRILVSVTCLVSGANLLLAQWVQTNGPYGGYVRALAVCPPDSLRRNLFAGTNGDGVLLSTNDGTSWTAVNTGLTDPFVNALAAGPALGGANLFAGTTSGGVFLSTNNGTTWTAVNTGLANTTVLAFAVSPNGVDLFARTDNGGVFRSTNDGTSWTAVNIGLTNTGVSALAASPDGVNLFAATYSGIFLSTDNGASWTAVNEGLPDPFVNALAMSPDGANLFAGTVDNGVFRSTNNGANWTAIDAGLTDPYVNTLVVSPNGANLFAGTVYGGVFLSTNNGTTWTAVNTGLTDVNIHALAFSPAAGDTNLFAGTFVDGVFLSTNSGTTWTAVNTGLTSTAVLSFAASPASGARNIFAGTWGEGIFLSTNDGTSWSAVNAGLTNTYVYSLAVSSAPGGMNLFAGTSGGVIFSTNNGTSWTAVNSGLTNTGVFALAVSPSGTNVFAGTYGGGVFLSTNNGASWRSVNAGLTNTYVYALAVSPAPGGMNLFAGTLGGGAFLSTDNGTNWRAVNTGLGSLAINALAVSPDGASLFAGTYSGVFLTTNNGTSWTAVNAGLTKPAGVTNPFVTALAISPVGTNLFAGTYAGGVFLSTNNGTSWTPVNTGLFNINVNSLAISPDGVGGLSLFAGTNASGVWRRPLSEMVPIDLSVGSISAHAGDTVLVPIIVTFPPGKTYSSAELNFGGYQNHGLSFICIDTTSTLVGKNGWQFQVNNTDTLLLTASAGAEDIFGSGVVFDLKFAVGRNACAFIPVTIEKAVFNTGSDSAAETDGGVGLVRMYGDLDGDGHVRAYDASLVLKLVADSVTLDCQALANANVSCDSSVSAYDASLILQRTVGLIDTLPFCSQVQAAGTIAMVAVTVRTNDTVEVPLYLNNGSNIFSFEGTISYDAQYLTYLSVDWPELLRGFTIVTNPKAGTIKFAAASSIPDGQAGLFAMLRFGARNSLAATTVKITSMRWNEGEFMKNVDSAQVVVGVNLQKNILPREYSLALNYPNPFNPGTLISYTLPKNVHAKLVVYDVLGRVIATLVDGVQSAGYYQETFDGSHLSSGVYYYRLEAGGNARVRKMLLAK